VCWLFIFKDTEPSPLHTVLIFSGGFRAKNRLQVETLDDGDPACNRRRRRAPSALSPACLSAEGTRAQTAGWRAAASPQQPVALVATPKYLR